MTRLEEARDLIYRAEVDLGHLSPGQRRDLLADNTDWTLEDIYHIVLQVSRNE